MSLQHLSWVCWHTPVTPGSQAALSTVSRPANTAHCFFSAQPSGVMWLSHFTSILRTYHWVLAEFQESGPFWLTQNPFQNVHPSAAVKLKQPPFLMVTRGQESETEVPFPSRPLCLVTHEEHKLKRAWGLASWGCCLLKGKAGLEAAYHRILYL